MRRTGSIASHLRLRFQLVMDAIERKAPRVDSTGLWLGIALTILGTAVTAFHNAYPGHSLTDTVVRILGAAIGAVHSLLPWSVGDTVTFTGVPLAILSLTVRVVRWLNRRGSTGLGSN